MPPKEWTQIPSPMKSHPLEDAWVLVDETGCNIFWDTQPDIEQEETFVEQAEAVPEGLEFSRLIIDMS